MQNNKDVRSMLKDAGILFAITLIAGLILGFVYEVTKEPIQIQKEKEIQAACNQVFADAESFDSIDYTPSVELKDQLAAESVEIGTVYAAKDSAGTILGYVLESTSGAGYAGDITLYVGITLEGKLNEVSILEISETPGLGMRAEEVLVPQFKDTTATIFSYTKTGSVSESEIDAISGATITTNAVVDAVNGAVSVVLDELVKGGGANE